MRERQVRRLAAGLGLVTLAFGATPLLAPRLFSRLCGFSEPDTAVGSMVRSLGVRDTVMGLGLWSAATHCQWGWRRREAGAIRALWRWGRWRSARRRWMPGCMWRRGAAGKSGMMPRVRA